jgi:hypothetical protein
MEADMRLVIAATCWLIAEAVFGQGTFSPYAAGGIAQPASTPTQPETRNRQRGLSVFTPRNMDIGTVARIGECEIFQVIDDDTCLIRYPNWEGISDHNIIMARIPTKGLVDEKKVCINGVYKCTGTTSYKTPSGGRRTVYVIESYDPRKPKSPPKSKASKVKR